MKSGVTASVTIQMRANKHYFPMVPFIMLHKVVLTFESVDKTPKCYHSNKSFSSVNSCGAVYFTVQGDSLRLTLRMKSWNEMSSAF